MATIDNLTLEITANAGKSVDTVTKLATALGSLKSNLPSKAILTGTASGFKALAEEISKVSLSAKNLDKIKAIGTIANNLNKLNNVNSNVIKNTANGINALSASVSGISYEEITKIEKLAKALSVLPSSVSLKSIKNVVKASQTPLTSGTTNVNSQIGNSANQSINTASTKLENFWTKYQTIANLIRSNPISLFVMSEDVDRLQTLGQTLGMSAGAVGKLSKALGVANIAFSVISRVVGVFTGAIKKLTDPITSLVRSLYRVALYRALRGVIKAISQAVKEGIQNLALYSKALNELDTHSANNVMSRYASEFLYFKNAIATAVIPVLRGLIPIIETVINRIVDLINVIAQFGSAFFGGTFTKAKYFWVDYADSLDNATGSAKKLHHQLAGFDELNNLTDSNKGGGSDKLLDASQMFEESSINEKIKGFVDKIKGMFEGIKSAVQPYYERFKELWGKIVEKVSPHLKKIWDNLKRIWAVLSPIINSFTTGFLKGYLDGIDFKNLPDDLGKIAEAIADVTGMIADFFEKIDVEKVKDFAEKLGYMTGKANGALSPFNLLANAIHGFALAIDLSRLAGQKFAQWILEHLGDIIELRIKFENLRDKVNLATGAITTITDKIREFIVNVMSGSFGSNNVFGKAEQLAVNVKNTIQKVIDTINTFKSSTIASSGHGGIFTSANSSASILESTIQGIIKLINALNGMSATIKVNLEGSIASGFSGSALGGVAEAVRNIVDDAKEAVKTVTSSSVASTGHTSSQPSGYQYGNPNQQVKSLAELKKKANGGYVPNGDLFLANEKGAEFIGAIGGNTAVANNNQITEAIAQATYTAMSQALSENGGSVNIVVEGDADRMFKVFQKKQREVSRTAGLAY